jgi:LAO/AO transport system kinase
VGITGAPGAGKSTLNNALVSQLRAAQRRVAVLAIDPSSPFTGGAILGDRVRMGEHSLDDGVFIRSMATRGHLGGLSLAAREATRLLDAVGWPLVVIETVGVGQVEVAVVEATDTTVVVVNPGWGDAIQANKAGLLEIADIFVVNKADRDGADDAARDLENMLDLSHPGDWRPPVLRTVATEPDAPASGVAELLDTIDAHHQFLSSSGRLQQRRDERMADELREIIARSLEQRARALSDGDAFSDAYELVRSRELDPWTAANRLIEGV